MSHIMSKAKTKAQITDWRIVALSGKTADGREILPEDLADMADAYDPEKYAARINLEHLRFVFPYPEVSGFGDVVELKAEKQSDGKTALLARLSVNSNLQALWDADQKLYSSIEIAKPFADTGKAYLAGLAVTDSPASLGTSRHFSLAGVAAAAAIQNIQFSEYVDMNLNKPDEQKKQGLFAALLSKLSGDDEVPAADEGDGEVKNTPAAAQVEQLSAEVAEVRQEIQDAGRFSAELLSEVKKLRQEFAELKTQLETSPVSGFRRPHTGGGDAVKSEF